MATDWVFVCPKCNNSEWDRLFDTLKNWANDVRHKCSECQTESEIHLTFDFSLGAGPYSCKVLDVFLPDKIRSWPEDGKQIEYYPFLVIVESLDPEEGYMSVWSPYWHLKYSAGENPQIIYGQYASHLDLESFASLVKKASAKGYLS